MVKRAGLINGRYNLVKDTIRLGGMSYVQKARDLETDQEVAIKFLEDQPFAGLLKKIFEREVKGLQSLNHPNIVRYIDSGYTEDGAPFIVTEWIELSLSDVLKQHPDEKLRFDRVFFEIAIPLADALAYAHSRYPNAVEHRDIKVGNILMRDGRDPVLIDFGIGRTVGDSTNDGLTTADFASKPYAPPWDSPQNFLRDIYSFGVVLLRCLEGKELKGIENIETALTKRGNKTETFLRQCVNMSPSKIFTSGIELKSELRKFLAEYRNFKGANSQCLELILTNAAREHIKNDLAGNPSDSDAIRKLLNELSSGFHIEYALNDDLRTKSTGKVRIATTDRILVCIIDFDDNHLTAISAASQEYHVLDAMRNRAIDIGTELPIEIGPSRNSDTSNQGFNFLLRVLDQNLVSDKIHIDENVVAVDYLERLEKSLAVREKLINQASKLLPVENCQRKSNRIEISMSNRQREDHASLLEAEVELISNDTRTVIAQGEVVAQSGDEVAIVPYGRILNLRDAAFVRTSQYASMNSLRRQRDALEQIRSGNNPNSNFASILQDPKRAKASSSKPVTSWFLNLDEDKKSAVQMVLDSDDFCLVQGPPGTGKTQLISEVVQQTLKLNPEARILLVSQTHVAVDNAVERIGKSNLESMVRIAKSDRQILPSVEPFRLRNRAKIWRDNVRESAETFIARKLNESGFDQKSFLASQVIGELLAALDSKNRLQREYQRSINQSDEYTSLTIGHAEVGSESEIVESLSILSTRQSELVQKLEQVKPAWLHLTVESEELNSANQLATIQKALRGQEADQSNLGLLVELQSEWIERLTTDDSILEQFMKTRNVLAGTAIGFMSERQVSNLDFDLCIIDEASKATANELLVPISKSRKVLFVGDSRQLPPMSEIQGNEALLADAGISESEFSETLFEYLEESLDSERVRSLSTQYRMVEGIGNLISKVFYEGKLKSQNKQNHAILTSYSKPVTWLDTSRIDAQETQVAGSFSLQNPVEVQIILEEIQSLQTHLVSINTDQILETIVIAPYSAQVNALNKALRRIDTPNLAIECLTIDQVQGREADIAFVSLVRSNDHGKLGFLSDRRRLNVAFSRARYGLFIVGNAIFLQKSATRLSKVIAHIEEHPENCEMRVIPNE